MHAIFELLPTNGQKLALWCTGLLTPLFGDLASLLPSFTLRSAAVAKLLLQAHGVHAAAGRERMGYMQQHGMNERMGYMQQQGVNVWGTCSSMG
jgi:hypothetical protein